VAIETPARTRSRRDRVERTWHARGVPIVLGLDRYGDGCVVRATRSPLFRTPLADLPAPAQVMRDLRDHDARLRNAADKLLARAFGVSGHLRGACGPCADRLPVFGTVVPKEAAACDTYTKQGDLLFVSEQGRFY
jgi:hypothetical protein